MPLADSIKLVLEDTGNFEVCVETDSVSALAAARKFQPDVVLLDNLMPVLDGGDVSAQLKQDPFLSSLPIIVVTALVANSEAGRVPKSPACHRNDAGCLSPLSRSTILLLIAFYAQS